MSKISLASIVLLALFLASCSSVHDTLQSRAIYRVTYQPSMSTHAMIIGQLRDLKTGEPIEGGDVWLVGTNLGAHTDSIGNYRIEGILPGTYSLMGGWLGYKPARIDSILIHQNDIVIIDFQLTNEGVRVDY